MEAKDKAKQLTEFFKGRGMDGNENYAIKECALMVVNEVLNSNPCFEDSDRGGNFMWIDDTYYWQEVKKEINKI